MTAIALAALLGFLARSAIAWFALAICRSNPDMHRRVIKQMQGNVDRERALFEDRVNR